VAQVVLRIREALVAAVLPMKARVRVAPVVVLRIREALVAVALPMKVRVPEVAVALPMKVRILVMGALTATVPNTV
jgi:hypothetical protein